MNKERELEINYYMVAFIDLLGHGQELQKFSGLPLGGSSEELEKFYDICRDTFGAINGLHKAFNDYFSSYLNKKSPFDEIIQKPKIHFQRFSDGIVIFVSLREAPNQVPCQGIYGALSACSAVCLIQLAKGRPIRGGIEVGLGLEMSEGELYGPAIAAAYALENKVAQYPRVVLGHVLIDYLLKIKDLKHAGPKSQFASELASICIEMILIDHDGYHILDYLGPGFKQYIASKLPPKIPQTAYRYVNEQSEKWRNEKNTKLAMRYSLLRDYFEHRMPLWSDEEIQS